MKTQVVGAVVKKGNRFLLGKRSIWKKSAPGFWCPISGKIEQGESEEEAVRRETLEEVGLQIKPVRKIITFDSHDSSATINWWLVDIVDGEAYLKNDEHTELGWFTVSEMEKLSNIFPEDIELFKTLQS